jgi:hypothetical protein
MDKRIRRNELCVVGLPRCDFVFSSTRTCFIAYGFEESTLEMTILRTLLVQRGIQAVEAGGMLAPGQNAFCAKICSKIITAQFCAVLLNNDFRDGKEIPNANVNMEYGLMLGFNKYVIPFQRESQQLPFNVAGLDTVKYTNLTFEGKAAKAIDVAVAATSQETAPAFSPDQILEAFLLSKRVLVVPMTNDTDRSLFELGRPLGFNLIMTFDGMQYRYFGNFTALRPEAIVWRVRMLEAIFSERIGSLPQRVKMGLAQMNAQATEVLKMFMSQLQIWLLVSSDDDRTAVTGALAQKPASLPVQVFSLTDITVALQNMG